MSVQEVISLAIPPYLREKLHAAGITGVAELQRLGPLNLAKEANITPEDAYEVLRVAGARAVSHWAASTTSAVALYEQQRSARKIITFCSEFDAMLGGGVHTGQVTEFCGVPGVGKTQLGIQLAVDVQIPASFGGLQGQAVYVDTEGSFMAERVQDIAGAAVQHIRSIAARSGRAQHAEDSQQFTLESVLSGIYYFRIHDHTEQQALVHMLPGFVQHHPQVKLIIFDSITFHFRHSFTDMAQRTRLLTQLAQDLMALAQLHSLAVVFMNQITTKVLDDQSSKLVPALGESWGHAASTRVILSWRGDERAAHLYKSPNLPPGVAAYAITAAGVRSLKAVAAQ